MDWNNLLWVIKNLSYRFDCINKIFNKIKLDYSTIFFFFLKIQYESLFRITKSNELKKIQNSCPTNCSICITPNPVHFRRSVSRNNRRICRKLTKEKNNPKSLPAIETSNLKRHLLIARTLARHYVFCTV